LITLLGLKHDEKPTNAHKIILKAALENVAVFYGVPVIKRLSPQFKYFGMSVYQNIWKTMISDDLISSAVANIIYKSSFRNYKIKGFSKLIETGNEKLVLNRLQVSDLVTGIYGSNIMDSEDSLEILQQSLAGLSDLDRRSVERLSAATGIPATILLGKSPDGQNSTGDHDEKNFYIFVEQYQKKMLPGCIKIFDAIIKYLGIEDNTWQLEFNKPHSTDNDEQAKIDGLIMDNVLKMQALGISDDVIKRYLKEKQIITEDEYESEKSLKVEMDENIGLEEEGSTI
jgi:phage-related protein (TIGR01555 family)